MPGKFADKQYSLTWTPLFPFSPFYAYGDSLVRRMHNDRVRGDYRRGDRLPIENTSSVLNPPRSSPGEAGRLILILVACGVFVASMGMSSFTS